MLKKVLILILSCCFILSCKQTNDIGKPIEHDCEVLKEYLQDASIDVSLAIDDGLDIDNLISNIKTEYLNYYVPLSKKNNTESQDEKGIYREAFSASIAWVLQNNLPIKNAHNGIIYKEKEKNTVYTKYTFASDIYFELKENEYYVISSNVNEINQGMKYTGDKKNIVKSIENNKIVYRYVYFYEANIEEGKINIENVEYTIPVKFCVFRSDKEDIISYEIKNNNLFVTINLCETRTEEQKKKYEDTVKQISQEIFRTNNVIFDLRNNSGGYLNMLYPIIDSLVLGPDYGKKENDCIELNAIINSGSKVLNTKTIRNTSLLSNNNNFLINHKDERYPVYNPSINNNFIPNYSGNIIVIQSTGTCSAAEHFIAVLQYIFKNQMTIIGQKSNGLLDFGGSLGYMLPDSKIKLNLSYIDQRSLLILKENKKWHGDTEGFYPDYWYFSNDLNFLELFLNENIKKDLQLDLEMIR